MFAAERLAHHAAVEDIPLDLHILDKDELGTGPNFQRDLPDYALLNYAMGHVRPWGEGGSVLPPRLATLETWLADSFPEEHWDPEEPVARGLVGAYFEAALSALADNPPSGVRVFPRRRRVTEMERARGGWSLTLSGGERLSARAVLLATGVPFDAPLDEEGQSFADFAERHGLRYLTSWHRSFDFSDVVPAPLFVRGMGIAFIDVALALSEGRGGAFTEGAAAYRGSGREPVMVPYSREGLLPVPKTAGTWPNRSAVQFKYLDDSVVEGLIRSKTPIDFLDDVWPLIRKELAYQVTRARHDPAGLPHEPLALARRLGRLPDAPDRHAQLEARLERDLTSAATGSGSTPERVAIDLWGQVFPRLALLTSFGRLRPESDRVFREEVRPAWDRLAFGPPIVNGRKLLALIRSRTADLRLSEGRVEADENAGVFRLVGEENAVIDSKQAIQMVDAVIPTFHLDRSPPLFARLRARGHIRQFVNRGEDDEYPTGAVEVDERGFVVGASGDPDPTLAVVGAPTEGCVTGTDSLPSSRIEWATRWAEGVLELLRG